MDRSLIKAIFTEKNRRKRKREFNFICVDLNMHSNKSIQTCPSDIHFQRDSRIKCDNRLPDFRYWTDTEFKSYVSKFFDISSVFFFFTFLRPIHLLQSCSRLQAYCACAVGLRRQTTREDCFFSFRVAISKTKEKNCQLKTKDKEKKRNKRAIPTTVQK